MIGQPSSPGRRAIRGRVLTFRGDPAEVGEAASHLFIEDGAVLVEGGRIAALGEAREILAKLPDGTPVDDHAGYLILPGLIDTHIHFPQTQVIASYGAQLLEWLQKYTFVEEQKFGDPAHAGRIARFFLDELLRNGTTTAVVYCSVHPESAEAFFDEPPRRDTRMIAGKVMMDRGAPTALTDTAERGYRESKALLERWHGNGRQLYAISPRFALTSTEAQLQAAGALAREHRTPTSRPICARTTTRSRPPGACSRRRAATPTSTTASGCSARARCSATASTSRTRRWSASPRPARSRCSARPRTCSSAAACSTWRGCAIRAGRCGSASRPTSAAAPATPCCGPPPRRTRCSSCAARTWPRSRPSTS